MQVFIPQGGFISLRDRTTKLRKAHIRWMSKLRPIWYWCDMPVRGA